MKYHLKIVYYKYWWNNVIHDAENLDFVMLMYNMLEYSSDFSHMTDGLWFMVYWSGFEIKFFVRPVIFSADVNHIAVYLLQLRVLMVQKVLCLVKLLPESFLILAIKKYLICWKLTFSQLFNLIFFSENTTTDYHLISNTINSKQNKARIFINSIKHL